MKHVLNGFKLVSQPKVTIFIAYEKLAEWPNDITYGMKLDGWPNNATYGIK